MEDNESDDNSLEIMDGFMPSRKTREKSPLPCPLPQKRAKTNPRSSVLQAGDTHFRHELTKSKGSVLEKSKMNAGVSFTRRESKGLNLTLLFKILILTCLLFHLFFSHPLYVLKI